MSHATHLLDAPTPSDEADIVRTCFGVDISQNHFQRAEYEEFFVYLAEQTSWLQKLHGPGGTRAWFLPVRTHQELLKVTRILQQHGASRRRPQIREAMMSEFRWESIQIRPEVLNSIIDAALRLWLLVNFLNPKHRGVTGGQGCVEWDDETTLDETISGLFVRSKTELTLSQRRLHPHFTAANMVRICRIKIEWTSSLENHLLLDRESKRLWVFDRRNLLLLKARSASASRTLLQSGQSHPDEIAPIPFSKDFYEETSRTLDLLFPSWDHKTQQLLNRRGKSFHTHRAKPRSLDLRNYPFWMNRLLEINEDVFLAPAEGWAQLWLDRRDPQKFWTFWIALAIFMLAIVSTAASIIQTWATIRSMNEG